MGDISIGRFENGSLTKIGLHAIMGGLAVEAAGGDFKSGALVAGANKAPSWQRKVFARSVDQ